jgi:hypothetical protein
MNSAAQRIHDQIEQIDAIGAAARRASIKALQMEPRRLICSIP